MNLITIYPKYYILIHLRHIAYFCVIIILSITTGGNVKYMNNEASKGSKETLI